MRRMRSMLSGARVPFRKSLHQREYILNLSHFPSVIFKRSLDCTLHLLSSELL